MKEKSKQKRIRSLRKQLKKLSNSKEYRRWSYGIAQSDNPNQGGPGGYCATINSFPVEILTRSQRIEQAIRALNGGKL